MGFFFGMLLKIVYITQTEINIWYIKTVFTRLIAVKGKTFYMVAYRYAQTQRVVSH